MARFQLNLKKPNNYGFFCPVSRLHLTVSNPVGYAGEVTPAILRGIRSGSIIDIEGAAGSTSIEAEQKVVEEPRQAEQLAPAQETEPVQQKPKRNKRKEQNEADVSVAENPVTEENVPE